MPSSIEMMKRTNDAHFEIKEGEGGRFLEYFPFNVEPLTIVPHYVNAAFDNNFCLNI